MAATTYATVSDVQTYMGVTFDTTQTSVCQSRLEEAAFIIDAYNSAAESDAKKVVSVRAVSRVMASEDVGVPVGASQGSMSALGYSQSWTISSGGGSGEIYLGKIDKKLLGLGAKIGSYSPTQELVPPPIIPEVLG